MLKFYYGTMSSGKTLHLLATAHNFLEKGIPFITLKSAIDTRDGDGTIHSRALGDGDCITIEQETNLYALVNSLQEVNLEMHGKPIKWVLVDEAQFLTSEQVEELAAIADNLNIRVMCYGLRTDFQTNLFEGSQRLFEIADSIEEIKSSCECDEKTIFNARIDSDGRIVTRGEQVEIGGDERYEALCRKCYFTRTSHPLYEDYSTDEQDNEE